jgi:DNA processing protein
VRLATAWPGLGTLHLAGHARLLDRPAIAIVGSRRASHQGRALAAEVSTELVHRGLVVLSGLAAGIDATAHESAILAGGRTIAVIGTSLDQAYPRANAALQDQIARDHLLVSPFETGTPTARWHFPKRNCVMAHLAKAMVLIEAGESSGTRYQVQECNALGKPVFVHDALLEGERIPWITELARRGHLSPWVTPIELGAAVEQLGYR